MKNLIFIVGLCVQIAILGVLSCRRSPAAVQPIPEYAPTEAVLVSDILFADNLPGKAIAQAVAASGTKLIVATGEPESETERLSWIKHNGLDNLGPDRLSIVPMDHDSQWVRDYGPVFINLRNAGAQDRLGLVDLRYKGESTLDDSIPYQLGLYLNGDVRHVPLQFDGGNFLTDGRRCYVTTAVLTYNPRLPRNEAQAQDEVRRLFRERIGCQETVFFPDAPHEHIDMWAKVINDKTVLVNAITPETIAKMSAMEDYQWQQEMLLLRDRLDRMAEQFSKYLTVVRLPMPVPYRSVFRTYANALLMNKQVLMPHYQQASWPVESYPDEAILPALEAEARKIYEQFGYHVTLVPSDQLVASGGALHCVASQIPRLGKL